MSVLLLREDSLCLLLSMCIQEYSIVQSLYLASLYLLTPFTFLFIHKYVVHHDTVTSHMHWIPWCQSRKQSSYFHLIINSKLVEGFCKLRPFSCFSKSKNINQICLKIWHYFLIGEAYILWHASATQCILHTHCQPWQQTPFCSFSPLSWTLRIKITSTVVEKYQGNSLEMSGQKGFVPLGTR